MIWLFCTWRTLAHFQTAVRTTSGLIFSRKHLLQPPTLTNMLYKVCSILLQCVCIISMLISFKKSWKRCLHMVWAAMLCPGKCTAGAAREFPLLQPQLQRVWCSMQNNAHSMKADVLTLTLISLLIIQPTSHFLLIFS